MPPRAPRLRLRTPRLRLLPGILLALALGACQEQRQPAAAPAAAATAAAVRLLPSDGPVRVRRVRLYASGVGFIEASGTVQGPATTELQLRREDIDDLLKSLTAGDLDGGRFCGVEFPAQQPLAQALAGSDIDLASDAPLAELLTDLRGARVTVRWQAERISGEILAIAYHREWLPGDAGAGSAGGSVGGRRFIDQALVQLLLPDGVVRQVPLSELADLHFDEVRLQEQLAQALAAISQARARERERVLLRWQGQGARRVQLGYCQQMPVWKTSYRLLLPRAAGAGGGAEAPTAKLLGWAIVENESGEDWQGIQLSLVSGRPSSFIERLSLPLYLKRPTLVVEREAAPLPPTDRGGTAGSGDLEGHATVKGQRRAAGRFGGVRDKARDADQLELQEESIDRLKSVDEQATGAAGAPAADMDGGAVDAEAQASALGSLLSFDLSEPVSVPRQHAAMLPIVASPIQAEPVSIYNQQVLASHPLTGAALVNTTGLALPPGPVTVYDGGGYGGDASLATFGAGEHRLISFGIDLPVRVDATSASSEAAVSAVAIAEGVLTLRRRELRSTVYKITVGDQRPRQLVIEQAVDAQWTPVDTPAPLETTASLRRWRLSCPAAGLSFTVHQEHVEGESIGLADAGDEVLATYVSSDAVSPGVKQALAGLLAERRGIAALEEAIAAAEARRQQLEADQERIRGDCEAVQKSSALGQRLLAKLGEEDGAIDAIDAEQAVRRAELLVRQRLLSERIARLTVR